MKALPLISWPGGKTRHLKRLLPHIPEGAGYVEAFAGGCALLLAKPKSRMEVVNDVNGDLINLYRCAANHPDELARKLGEIPPASRDFIDQARQLLRAEVAKLQCRWIVTLDDSPFNRDLFKGCDVDFITTRNGSGNQAKGPTRHYGEMIIHSPGLRKKTGKFSKLSA